jgi:Flp pilus assembly protein TadG
MKLRAMLNALLMLSARLTLSGQYAKKPSQNGTVCSHVRHDYSGEITEGWALRVWMGLLQRFSACRRGNVAITFALVLVPMVIAMGAGLDYGRAVMVRANLTEALDAAGLAVGSSGTLSAAATQALAQSYFNANYKVDSSFGTPVAVTVTQSGQDFTLNTSVTMPTVLMQLAGINALPVSSSVTITRNSKNIEVALALDITGSMAGTKITDLKTAANDLIDIVVQDTQTPTYTKVAIIPYTNAVNVGSYATQVRGPVIGTVAITGATNTSNKPVVVTATKHGYVNNDLIYITGVSGMTQINNTFWTVANATTNTFELSGTDGKNFSKYTSGGTSYCTWVGCELYRFTSDYGSVQALQVSTCVSERTTNAFTDVAPSSTYLGFNYPAVTPSIPLPYGYKVNSTNPCLTPTIIPLSSDRTALKAVVNGLTTGGSTAGHIGIAWSWYMLAPNFASLWPSSSQPAAYNQDNYMKVAIIMTDGAFNTAYCKAVISNDDSGSGNGDSRDHANCASPNGNSATQAKALCSAMKAKGIIVYTVGFQVGTDATALSTLNSCATDSAHAYFPASGSDLKSAFHDIAQQITNLRIKT